VPDGAWFYRRNKTKQQRKGIIMHKRRSLTDDSAVTRSLLTQIQHKITLAILALLLLCVPGSLLATPIVIRINDLAVGPPEVEVDGAPLGYNVYTGPEVNNPSVEDGALITLFGVDQGGSIADWGGRFVDPSLPADAVQNALDIVWVQHDCACSDCSCLFGNGDLQIGFNSRFLGGWYYNPIYTGDENLGPVPYKWVTVYSSPKLVIQFKAQKPH
jgi:hypothetical protein